MPHPSMLRRAGQAAALAASWLLLAPLPGHADTPASGTAGAEARVNALAAFARCDASFFNLLGQSPDLLGAGVQMERNGNAAAPKVPDPLADTGRTQTFAQPLTVGGMQLLAWHNEVSYDATMGAFLFWGFRVAGAPDTTARALNALLEPTQRIALVPSVGWARAEHRLVGDPLNTWRPGGASSTVTTKGTVERVLILEAGDSPDQTTMYCSLQGSVTPVLLDQIRPDLLKALQK